MTMMSADSILTWAVTLTTVKSKNFQKVANNGLTSYQDHGILKSRKGDTRYEVTA